MISNRLDVLLEHLDEAKGDIRLLAGQKNKINRALYDFTSPKGQQRYFRGVPVPEIWKLLKKHGVVPIDTSDRSEWEGFITGREGRENFPLAPKGSAERGQYPKTYVNTALLLSWYKMPSGKYEVVAYIG